MKPHWLRTLALGSLALVTAEPALRLLVWGVLLLYGQDPGPYSPWQPHP